MAVGTPSFILGEGFLVWLLWGDPCSRRSPLTSPVPQGQLRDRILVCCWDLGRHCSCFPGKNSDTGSVRACVRAVCNTLTQVDLSCF